MASEQMGEKVEPVICLLCEYGLCRQGCWSPTCQCSSTHHLSIDYEAERPRASSLPTRREPSDG